jgi:hypothetical protein
LKKREEKKREEKEKKREEDFSSLSVYLSIYLSVCLSPRPPPFSSPTALFLLSMPWVRCPRIRV